MPWKKRGAHNWNRKRHAQWRENPSRSKHLLREAVQDAGLVILGVEYEVSTEDYPVWFDVAVQLESGPGMIFLMDTNSHALLANTTYRNWNYDARQRKLRYCWDRKIPFCEVWPTSQARMRAQIELWLSFYRRIPYKEAGPRPDDKEGIRVILSKDKKL